MPLNDHPTVLAVRERTESPEPSPDSTLKSEKIRKICLEAGAADVGFAEVDRPVLEARNPELPDLLRRAKTVVSLAFSVNRENIRCPAHSVANLEFREAWAHANRAARTVTDRLNSLGVRALNTPAGFPYEADRWPGKMWSTCDKIIAEEAGLGKMGWNRLVLHPELGSAVIFGNVLMTEKVDTYDSPIDFNPCVECKLCVSACPVGAIGKDGYFDFVSCYTHNYRERIGGFSDWVERVVRSRSVKEYRRSVSDAEAVSMWQNLSIGAQTRCDRCMAVCPAGTAGIGEYIDDRVRYIREVVQPMRDMEEKIYVVRGSDAEAHVTAEFPHKTLRRVSNGVRPNSIKSFLMRMRVAFQRNQAKGLDARFHFTFTGAEPCEATVVIKDRSIHVKEGLDGSPDIHVTADSATWLSFLAKETSLLRALITRKIKVKGSPKLMKAFASCFPS